MTAVALLRGINVGGKRQIPMAELRAALGEAGFDAPRTHLQSGNVMLATDDEPALAGRIANVIEDTFGFAIEVVTRDADDLARIVDANPFASEAREDPAKVHVFLLDAEPETGRGLDPDRSPADRHTLQGREVYVHYPNGSGRSRLDLGYIERTLGVTGTVRNIRTLAALVELARAR